MSIIASAAFAGHIRRETASPPDDPSNPVYAAWGVTKLVAAYSGAAIRVKRSSDNAQTDIGFASGVLDVAAANTFGSNLKVVKVYDQSGNSRDLTAMTFFEPVLDTSDVAMTFNGQGFDVGDLSALTAGEIIYRLKQTNNPPTSAGNGSLARFGTSGINSHVPFSNGLFYDDFGTSSRKDTGASTAVDLTAYYTYGAYSAPNDWANFVNGTQLYATGTNTVGFRTNATIGRNPDEGTYYFLGSLKSVQLFNRKLTTAERSAYCVL